MCYTREHCSNKCFVFVAACEARHKGNECTYPPSAQYLKGKYCATHAHTVCVYVYVQLKRNKWKR